MQPVSYPVRLSTALRVGYVGVGIVCLSMAADSAGADIKTQVLAWGFFGFGGLLVLKLMLRNSGTLTLREEGLLIDTYWSTGLIRWEQLQDAREVRLLGMRYLGLNSTDPSAYLKSRESLPGLENETNRVCTQGFTRGMIAMLTVLPVSKMIVNAALTVCGWSPLPKSTGEAEMLAWQGKNYGAQITIPRMFLPDFDRLLKDLRARAQGQVKMAIPESTDVPSGPRLHQPDDPTPRPESAHKTCPMCAEEIQAHARICRYCRYSFDEKRLLPSA